MKSLWLSAALVLFAAPTALAQTASRFVVGPVVRVDKVRVQGGVSSVMPVFGAIASMRLSKIFGVEGEITQAPGRELVHSYEGYSSSGSLR